MRAELLGPMLEALTDATCAAYSTRRDEGLPAGTALELAAGPTGELRLRILERFTRDGALAFADDDVAGLLGSHYAASPSPCRAAAVLWAVRHWPEAAPPGLLERLIAAPPDGVELVSVQAIDALAETGQAGAAAALEPLVEGARGSRLRWHALRAQARLADGDGARVAAVLTDPAVPFDEELAAAVPHVLQAVEAEARADVVQALLRADDPVPRGAALASARDPAVAAHVAADLAALGSAGVALDGMAARNLVGGLLGAGDRAAASALGWDTGADPDVRLAALVHAPPHRVAAALDGMPLDGLDDGTLLMDAVTHLGRASPDAARAALRRLAADPSARRALEAAPDCAGGEGALVDRCLRALGGAG